MRLSPPDALLNFLILKGRTAPDRFIEKLSDRPMVLNVEYAFLTDGIVPAFGADLFTVYEHSEIQNE